MAHVAKATSDNNKINFIIFNFCNSIIKDILIMILRNRKQQIKQSSYELVEEPIPDKIFGHYFNDDTVFINYPYPGGFVKVEHNKHFRAYYNCKVCYKIYCTSYKAYLRQCLLENKTPLPFIRYIIYK